MSILTETPRKRKPKFNPGKTGLPLLPTHPSPKDSEVVVETHTTDADSPKITLLDVAVRYCSFSQLLHHGVSRR